MGKRLRDLKLSSETSSDEISKYLSEFAKQNTPELPFGPVYKILIYIGCVEATTTGSSIKFYHKALVPEPYWRGYMQIHRKHKGGNKIIIRRTDLKKYLIPPVLKILEYNKQKETKN